MSVITDILLPKIISLATSQIIVIPTMADVRTSAYLTVPLVHTANATWDMLKTGVYVSSRTSAKIKMVDAAIFVKSIFT